MAATADRLGAGTPWAAGCLRGASARLTFGCTYADPAIELAAFAPGSRIFCIAAAGGMPRALAAAGHRVTAVDINPAQIEYAGARADGAPEREGTVDRFLRHGRWTLAALGWSKSLRRAFLELEDRAVQAEMWRCEFDTARYRAAVDTALSRPMLALAYRGRFVARAPRPLGPIMRARMARAWATHPNRPNPWAWRLLLGRHPQEAEPAKAMPIRFFCADAAEYLESCPCESFDAFSLSNIGDGAPQEFLIRLRTAVRRASAPKAVVVSRSFAEADPGDTSNQAQRDRSLIWGTVSVRSAGEL